MDLGVQLSLLILGREYRGYDISHRIFYIISGCFGLAVCLTFIYLKKLKEKKELRDHLKRMTQYSSDSDQNNFVAEKYMEEITKGNILDQNSFGGKNKC